MRVLKTEIPVDDRWHDVEIGSILQVGSQYPDVVAIWWMQSESDLIRSRRLRVYGTGQDIEMLAEPTVLRPYYQSPVWVGTAVVPQHLLVWHLFEDVL
jgi:hypothetical protein